MINLQAPGNIIASPELQQLLGYEYRPRRPISPDDAVYILSRPDDFSPAHAALVTSQAAAILTFAAMESQLRSLRHTA